MAKQRRRVVPVRRVRLTRGDNGWEVQSMVDRPPAPVPPSAEVPGDGGTWAEAVDRHDVVLHRVVLDPSGDGATDVLVPIDTRCVGLNLFEGEPGADPVATFAMTGGGAGSPIVRR